MRPQLPDQPPAQHRAERERGSDGQQRDHQCLAEHHPAQLARRRADGAQQCQFTLTLLGGERQCARDDKDSDLHRQSAGNRGEHDQVLAAARDLREFRRAAVVAGQHRRGRPHRVRDPAGDDRDVPRGEHADRVDVSRMPGQPFGVGRGEEQLGMPHSLGCDGDSGDSIA